MKSINKKIKLVMIVTILTTIQLTGCVKAQDSVVEKPSAVSDQNSINESYLIEQISSIPKEELSQGEIDGLLFIREEEKLARDVYLTLNKTYPLRPFENISKSEQQHMDAIKYLLDRYDIEDPAKDTEIGIFRNKELQDLFNTLIETGKEGKIEALKVGALIEEKDIFDLDFELKNTVDNKDISFVYENLVRASMNHIRAFTRVLSLNGVDYTPEILEQTYYEEIIKK